MDTNFKNIVDSAIRQCDGYNVLFDYKIGMFLKIYSFATECIDGYIREFDLKDKSLLTVGSSSDQVFNAALFDCKDITLFDINPYFKYYYYLKLSALKCLDRDEFLKFLMYIGYPTTFKYNYDSLKKEVFDKIKYNLFYLDEESYHFWESLYDKFDGITIRCNLFTMDQYKMGINDNINTYLKDDNNYNLLKSKISNININFIEGDFMSFNHNKTYDNIWLSNIALYFETYNIRCILEKYMNYLNKDGNLLLTYLYANDNYKDYLNEVIDYNVKVLEFNGIDSYKREDNIKKDRTLIYKKTI